MRCTRAATTPHDATWRVSTPADPWPLQYACDAHLPAITRSLGGDCRVTLLMAGMPTPDPRTTGPAARALSEPDDDRPGPAAADTRLRAELGRCPTLGPTGPCMLDDTAQAHRLGTHETTRTRGRATSWPTAGEDLERWGMPRCPAENLTSTTPYVKVRCDLEDSDRAHAAGRVHVRRIMVGTAAARTVRWPWTP